MSERGSVSSQYFYCVKCCEATEKVFQQWYEYVTVVTVPDQGEGREAHPIIVIAKSHCGWRGEELFEFENDVAPDLAKALCHPTRFAIIAEAHDRQGIALVTPGVPRPTWIERDLLADVRASLQNMGSPLTAPTPENIRVLIDRLGAAIDGEAS
jgi:hypothetical protein